MAKRKRRKPNRREAARRRKISRANRVYWKRVKRLAKKSGKTVARARKLYKAGLGRPKSQRKKRERKRVKAVGELWKGSEFVTSFEENQREWIHSHKLSVVKGEHEYTAEVVFERDSKDGEVQRIDDEFKFTCKGEDTFWSEWWIAAKEWLALIVEEFEPENLSKEDVSPDGAAIVERITYAQPEE